MAYFDFPSTPVPGQVFTPSGGPTYVWDDVDKAWRLQAAEGGGGGGGAKVTTADVPPTSPVPTDGDMWWETDTGKLYVYYDDGDSQQWVQSQGAMGGPGPQGVPGPVAGQTAQARNRVCNPCMAVSQENGNTAGTGNAYYCADQWHSSFVSSSTITAARSYGPLKPNGSISIVASPAETAAAAGEYVAFVTRFEGLNVADFMFGAANSQQVVIAFDVFIPVAGTYWIAFVNGPATHEWLGSYTISAAEVSTWVRKSIVIPAGAINAGTWPTDNTAGVILRFTFHCGSTNTGVAGFQSGTFYAGPGQALGLSTATPCYLTNVALHLDADATGAAPPFQVPAYDDDLRACKRYYRKYQPGAVSGAFPMGSGSVLTTTEARFVLSTEDMRIAPTSSFSAPADFAAVMGSSALTASAISAITTGVGATVASVTVAGAIVGYAGYLRATNVNGAIMLSARM